MAEATAAPEIEAYAEMLETCASLQLRKATRVVTQLYDEALRPVGLRSTQLPVLITLAAHGALSVSDLADGLVLDRTTLIRKLQPLRRQGFVGAGRGEGQRSRRFALTAAGAEAVAAAVPLWAQAQARVTEVLGAVASRDLQRTLSRLVLLLP